MGERRLYFSRHYHEESLMSTFDDPLLDDYGVGVWVSKVVSFVGWVVVLIGGVSLIKVLGEAIAVGVFDLGMIAPLYTIGGGFMAVAMGQASRAVMDNANDGKRVRILVNRILDEIKSESPQADSQAPKEDILEEYESQRSNQLEDEN